MKEAHAIALEASVERDGFIHVFALRVFNDDDYKKVANVCNMQAGELVGTFLHAKEATNELSHKIANGITEIFTKHGVNIRTPCTPVRIPKPLTPQQIRLKQLEFWRTRFRAQSEIKSFGLFVSLERQKMREQAEAMKRAEADNLEAWRARKKELLAKQAQEAAAPPEVTIYK